jgi:gas vesicle protein
MMSMPLEDMEKMKKEVAGGADDRPDELKIPEIGYFYLAQQINNLMQMLNESRNNTDMRFDNQRQEFKAEIRGLREEIKNDISELKGEFNDFRNNTDIRFDNQKQEFKAEIKGLKDEIKNDISELKGEFNGIKTWFIGTIVGIVGIIIAIVGLILKP